MKQQIIRNRCYFLLVWLLTMSPLTTGCIPKSLVLNAQSLGNEAALFDTIKLDPNNLHGIKVIGIDDLNPYVEQKTFKRLYGDDSHNSLVWTLSPGIHKLSFLFQDSATILGNTAKSKVTFTFEMEAGKRYVPLAHIIGEEVEWWISDKNDTSRIYGKWRTPLIRGTTFNLNPAAQTLD